MTDSDNHNSANDPAADKQAQGAADDDFIPKFSQVKSKHSDGETPQGQSPAAERDSERVAAELSAAALAIEMAAVTSFDHVPVTEVKQPPQSFQPKKTGEIDMSEFGFHKDVREQIVAVPQESVAPQLPVAPPAPPPTIVPTESVVDSLIFQSEALDEIWTSPGQVLASASLTGIPAQSPPPVPETPQQRKERAAVVRGSLYWVVQEARLVTHGVFSDYGGNTVQPEANGTHDMSPPVVAAEVPAPAPEEVVSQLSAYQSVAPAEAKTVYVPDGHDAEVVPELSTGSNLKPDLYRDEHGNSVKPDIAISQRITGSRPKDPKDAQRITADRMSEQRNTAERALEQRTTSERALDQRTTSERSRDQQSTTGGGGRKPPVFGRVDKEKFKKGAITVGSVFILCVACGVIMYDWVNSMRTTEQSRPAPGLQQPETEKPDEPVVEEEKKTQADEKKQASKDELKEAFQLEQKKEYERALDLFDGLIREKGKQYPQALHGRGRVYTKLQRYDEGLKDLKEASDLDPKNELILIDLAAVKYLLNDFSGAAREYERILTTHENDIDALYGRGISYAGMGQNEQALADFENVVKLKPGYDMAYRQMCKTYLAMGQPDKADAAITVAMKACGSDADLYFSRALSRYQTGRKEDSLEDYNEAIRMSPKRKEYYNDRGYVLMDLGRLDEARKDFQKALELDPQYKLAAENLKRLRKVEKNK